MAGHKLIQEARDHILKVSVKRVRVGIVIGCAAFRM